MPKVEIDTPGVTVRMEADEISVQKLAKLALDTYIGATKHDQPKSIGSGTGFTTERSWPVIEREADPAIQVGEEPK